MLKILAFFRRRTWCWSCERKSLGEHCREGKGFSGKKCEGEKKCPVPQDVRILTYIGCSIAVAGKQIISEQLSKLYQNKSDMKGEKNFCNAWWKRVCWAGDRQQILSVIWVPIMCDKRICLIPFARCLLSISPSFFPNDNGSLSNCQYFLSIGRTPETGEVAAVNVHN